MIELFLICALQCADGVCPPDAAEPMPQVAAPVEGVQRSVVVRSFRLFDVSAPRWMDRGPARKLAGAGFRVVRYGLKGGAKLIRAPFRAARAIHDNSLARRAMRGNTQAARRLSAKQCRRCSRSN